MKVMVLGIRGLPNVPGGIETHAEQLYRRIAKLGCEIEVIVRSPFVPPDVRRVAGIRVRRIWAPRRTGLEAFVHSFLGLIYAAFARPDVLHVHAIGPAIVAPFAHLLGLKVLVTHHGPDYERDKWGAFARAVLRTGERFGMRYSDARVAISNNIAEHVRKNYGVDCDLIPNGVVVPQKRVGKAHLETFGLKPGRYFLHVSRLVPEKRHIDLIDAFKAARTPGWKLALVGGIGADEYSRQVVAAASDPDIVMTGFQNGEALEQLYAHAGAFVLPSSHEGLPIALLEALSYGLRVLASDIPAHLEVGLERSSYFRSGDLDSLRRGLEGIMRAPNDPSARAARRDLVRREYDWDRIAAQTEAVYERIATQH
jgi:glycosyltransferase involved in cell wall biosynthesis